MSWMMTSRKLLCTLLQIAILWMIPTACSGLSFTMPARGEDIVGQIQIIAARPGDTLSRLGLRYNIGYIEMLEANPDLDAQTSLEPGTEVIIPSQFILPSIRQGLVINLAELRLYYFAKDGRSVHIFPISAGKQGWQTPIGTTTVVTKIKDPTWTVPASIKQESAKRGKLLPDVVPPGPSNPLGKYALRLGMPGILIHGSTTPAGIGQRNSHGCIRMLASDIRFLYEHVPTQTTVNILHEQNKVGWLGNKLYLESVVPFAEHDDISALRPTIEAKIALRPVSIDWREVDNILQEQTGLPQVIGETMSSATTTLAKGFE